MWRKNRTQSQTNKLRRLNLFSLPKGTQAIKTILFIFLMLSSLAIADSGSQEEKKGQDTFTITPAIKNSLSSFSYELSINSTTQPPYDFVIHFDAFTPANLALLAWEPKTQDVVSVDWIGIETQQRVAGIARWKITDPLKSCDIGFQEVHNDYFAKVEMNGTFYDACLSKEPMIDKDDTVFTFYKPTPFAYSEKKPGYSWKEYIGKLSRVEGSQYDYTFEGVNGSSLKLLFSLPKGIFKKGKFAVSVYASGEAKDGGPPLFYIDPVFDPTGWKYYRVINISGAFVDGTQFILKLNSSFPYAHAKADGSDLRVAFYNGSLTEYGIFIESWNVGGTSRIHFNATNATGEMRLYYGNPAASNVSDIQTVYPFADDFPLYGNGTHALNTSKWVNGVGASGVLNTSTPADWINLTTKGIDGTYAAISSIPKFLANMTELLAKYQSGHSCLGNHDIGMGFMDGSQEFVNSTWTNNQPAVCGGVFIRVADNTYASAYHSMVGGWTTFRLQRKSNSTNLYNGDYDNLVVSNLGPVGTTSTAEGLSSITFEVQANAPPLSWWALDWVAVRNVNLNLPTPSISLGAEHAAEVTTEIISPANGLTTKNNTLPFSVNASGTFNSYTCNSTRNGVTNSSNYTVLNASIYSVEWTLPASSYTLSVTCSNGTTSSTDTNLFTITNFLLKESFSAVVNETSTQVFNATLLAAPAGTADISASIWFNGTLYPATKLSNVSWSRSLSIPLILTNNSNVSHTWQFAFNYTNGTIAYENASEQQQAVYFAYLLGNVSYNTMTLLEGDILGTNISLISKEQSARLNVSVWVGSSFSYAGNSSAYHFFTTSQAVPDGSMTVNAYANISITFGSITRNFTTSKTTINIIVMNATNCSGGGYPVLLYLLHDEETLGKLNGTIAMTLTLWNLARTFSRNITLNNYSAASLSVCLANETTVYADSVLVYSNSSNESTLYPNRYHYLLNATLNPTAGSQNIYLYLLNASLASQVEFTIISSSGSYLPNTYIVAQRYYPASNTYRSVAMIRTGEFGKGNIPLQLLTTLYRFQIYRDYNLQKTTDTTTISCLISYSCSITIQVGVGPLIDYLTWNKNIGHSCVYDNAMNLLNCTVIDKTQMGKDFRLLVEASSALVNTPKCDVRLTTASGNLECSGLSSNMRYTYTLSYSDPAPHMLETGTINNASVDDLGDMGRLLGLFLFLAVCLMGIVIGDAFLGALFTLIGFVFLVLARLVQFSELTIGGLIIVGLIIAFKAAAWRK